MSSYELMQRAMLRLTEALPIVALYDRTQAGLIRKLLDDMQVDMPQGEAKEVA